MLAYKQRALRLPHDKVGDVLVAQGNLAEALKSYPGQPRHSPTAWPSPTPATPAGSAISRCRYDKVGDVLVAQGNLAEALKAYQRQPRHQRPPGQADPGNAGWQRDLSRVATTRSAMCWWRRAISPRR